MDDEYDPDFVPDQYELYEYLEDHGHLPDEDETV